MTEDEKVGWHHWLNAHESEQIPGDTAGMYSRTVLGARSLSSGASGLRALWRLPGRAPVSPSFWQPCGHARVSAPPVSLPSAWWVSEPPWPRL